MQDTNNLKKKLKKAEIEYKKAVRENNIHEVRYLEGEMISLTQRIRMRQKNRLKNEKQRRKSRGY